MKFSHEHGEAFIRALTCPVLLVLGADSAFHQLPYIRHLAALNPLVDSQLVPGGHHCHMGEGSGEIGALVRKFLWAGRLTSDV